MIVIVGHGIRIIIIYMIFVLKQYFRDKIIH